MKKQTTEAEFQQYVTRYLKPTFQAQKETPTLSKNNSLSNILKVNNQVIQINQHKKQLSQPQESKAFNIFKQQIQSYNKSNNTSIVAIQEQSSKINEDPTKKFKNIASNSSNSITDKKVDKTLKRTQKKLKKQSSKTELKQDSIYEQKPQHHSNQISFINNSREQSGEKKLVISQSSNNLTKQCMKSFFLPFSGHKKSHSYYLNDNMKKFVDLENSQHLITNSFIRQKDNNQPKSHQPTVQHTDFVSCLFKQKNKDTVSGALINENLKLTRILNEFSKNLDQSTDDPPQENFNKLQDFLKQISDKVLIYQSSLLKIHECHKKVYVHSQKQQSQQQSEIKNLNENLIQVKKELQNNQQQNYQLQKANKNFQNLITTKNKMEQTIQTKNTKEILSLQALKQENQVLHKYIEEQNQKVEIYKGKEEKMIKLLLAVKKRGVDIDQIYNIDVVNDELDESREPSTPQQIKQKNKKIFQNILPQYLDDSQDYGFADVSCIFLQKKQFLVINSDASQWNIHKKITDQSVIKAEYLKNFDCVIQDSQTRIHNPVIQTQLKLNLSALRRRKLTSSSSDEQEVHNVVKNMGKQKYKNQKKKELEQQQSLQNQLQEIKNQGQTLLKYIKKDAQNNEFISIQDQDYNVTWHSD